MENDKRGKYEHYKGHVYELLGTAKHSETLEELGIAYRRLDTDELVVWVRPEEMFFSNVNDRPRFTLLSKETSKTRIAELEAEVEHLKQQLVAKTAWSEDDRPIPEDNAILDAHPATCEKPDHELYVEAMRMVGAKRSKYALVDLVNWLLVRLKHAEVR